MNKERLLKLANFLERLPVELFDMKNWKDKDLTCGTVQCALGWATAFKSFNLKMDGNTPCFIDYDNNIYNGFEAASQVFDVPLKDAEYMFGMQSDSSEYNRKYLGYLKSNPSPRTVAKGIKNYVKTGKWTKV